MKKLLLLITLFFSLSFLNSYSQESTSTDFKDKIYIINTPSGSSYNHIYFPKTNFIKKRGGFANYEALIGKKIIVTKIVKEKKKGTIVSIQLEDGSKFFGIYPSIDSNISKAIERKELLEVN
jgi:hypothetical protein